DGPRRAAGAPAQSRSRRACREERRLPGLSGSRSSTMSNGPTAAPTRNRGGEQMAEGTSTAKTAKTAATAAEETQDLTDGFHLIIDALKLNGVRTIYGVPGIPITDFGRMAQASGIRAL